MNRREPRRSAPAAERGLTTTILPREAPWNKFNPVRCGEISNQAVLAPTAAANF
jgi:hypothetical protein